MSTLPLFIFFSKLKYNSQPEKIAVYFKEDLFCCLLFVLIFKDPLSASQCCSLLQIFTLPQIASLFTSYIEPYVSRVLQFAEMLQLPQGPYHFILHGLANLLQIAHLKSLQYCCTFIVVLFSLSKQSFVSFCYM